MESLSSNDATAVLVGSLSVGASVVCLKLGEDIFVGSCEDDLRSDLNWFDVSLIVI